MSDQAAAPGSKGRVVVGVDGSDPSLRALSRAVAEADRRGTDLEIVYAAGWPRRSAVQVAEDDVERIRTAAAELVDDAVLLAQETSPDLRVVPSVRTDAGAAEALVEAGRDAALTVVGTRGHGGFTGLLVGSVSLRVAAHCEGPVLVVGGHPEGRPRRSGHAPAPAPGGGGEHTGLATLVGLHNQGDDPALRFGFAEAVRRASALRVLHAWPVPRLPGRLRLPADEYAAARESARRLVDEAVAPYREGHPELDVRADEEGGTPAASLIEASRAADVVVLAVHRRPQRALGLQLGPVTHAVLHHAHCPVALVPVP